MHCLVRNRRLTPGASAGVDLTLASRSAIFSLAVLPSTGFPKEKFLGMCKTVLQQRPHAPPYYPGTKARHEVMSHRSDSGNGIDALNGIATVHVTAH